MERFRRNKPEVRQVSSNRVEVDGQTYQACSQCKKPLLLGYDSPEPTPPDATYNVVLCGPDYRAAYARVYPDAEVPDVPDGLLPT